MKKILCVDDNRSLLRLYHDELSDQGYEVILAKDGKEALLKFKEESPHLVILDIRMPGMDGIETLNALLGQDRQARVILNTAYPEYRQNFMTWGAEAYLVKSIDLEELKNTVREVLDRPKKISRSGGTGTLLPRRKDAGNPLSDPGKGRPQAEYGRS